MAQEDIQAIWTFFLREVRQCMMDLDLLNSSDCQDTLRVKSYQAYSSAILDVLNNLLGELACSERELACDTSSSTTTRLVTKTKLQEVFIKKLKTINTLIVSEFSAVTFLQHDILKLFSTLNELVWLEQLESDSATQKAFAHILIASLLPLLSSCDSKSMEQIKTVMQLQSTAPSKREGNTSSLLHSIMEAFILAEESGNILKQMCNGSDEKEGHSGFEAVASCVKLISDQLQESLSVSTWRNCTTKRLTGDEENDRKHPRAESKTLNIFLEKANTSLKSNFPMKKSLLKIEAKQGSNNNLLFLYRLEETIKRVLAENTRNTCQLTLSRMFTDYSLMDHVRGLRCILLMRAGIVMEQFCSEIIHTMEAATKWNRESLLTLSLHNCMSSGQLAWFSEHVSVELRFKSPGTLPELSINYSAPWPVNYVIQRDSLPLYNEVFQFLMKMKCSIAALQRLSFRGSSTGKRLYWLRSWMMHFLSNVYSFFMECVLERLYVTFDEKAARSDHVEQLAGLHLEYIRDIHHGCFLGHGSEFLNQPIREMADVVNEIVAAWNAECALDSVIRGIEDKFLYRYEYVVSVLKLAACRSKFQYVEMLISSLNH